MTLTLELKDIVILLLGALVVAGLLPTLVLLAGRNRSPQGQVVFVQPAPPQDQGGGCGVVLVMLFPALLAFILLGLMMGR